MSDEVFQTVKELLVGIGKKAGWRGLCWWM